MVFARDIHFFNQEKLLKEPGEISSLRENIMSGDIYIAKKAFPENLVLEIRNYLTRVGQYSLPNYHPIEAGAPNFHRINIWDDRSYVKACFHQFSFFPWNQDIFNLFDLSWDVYRIKNRITGLSENKFLGKTLEEGCAARLSFQFYPKGKGGMNKHSDPVDHHQIAVPMLVMSKKGKDFIHGGGFVEKEDRSKMDIDAFCDIGDIVYFNAQIPHGVDLIDPESQTGWLDFEGRWILLFAINKLATNKEISNAIDLHEKKASGKI